MGPRQFLPDNLRPEGLHAIEPLRHVREDFQECHHGYDVRDVVNDLLQYGQGNCVDGAVTSVGRRWRRSEALLGLLATEIVMTEKMHYNDVLVSDT